MLLQWGDDDIKRGFDGHSQNECITSKLDFFCSLEFRTFQSIFSPGKWDGQVPPLVNWEKTVGSAVFSV